MELKSEIKSLVIKTNKGEIKQKIEERIHPLTGERCIFNIARSTRPHDINKEDEGVLKRIIKESEKRCVFCSKRLENTPHLPEGGRIVKGEFKLFPNLYPFGEKHYVGVLCDKHFLYLNEFKEHHFYDALLTISEFSKSRNLHNTYPYISFNYLPPSGASLIHPHLQILFRKRRTNAHEIMHKRARMYYNKNKRNFWQDYYTISKKKNLLLDEGKRFYMAASFAPKGDKQIEIIHKKKSSFYSFDKSDLRELTQHILSVLRFYHSIGVQSLNFTTFSTRDKEGEEFFRFNLVIIARPRMKELASSDRAFMEVLHNHPIILTLPEMLKEKWDQSKSK